MVRFDLLNFQKKIIKFKFKEKLKIKKILIKVNKNLIPKSSSPRKKIKKTFL